MYPEHEVNMQNNMPKPPRKNCKKAMRWKKYYEQMANWYEESYLIIEKSQDAIGTKSLKLIAEEINRFKQGVRELENGTHQNIISGDWK